MDSSKKILLSVVSENKLTSVLLIILITIVSLLETVGITLIIPILVSLLGNGPQIDNGFIAKVIAYTSSYSIEILFIIVSIVFILKAIINQIAVAFISTRVAEYGYILRKRYISSFFSAKHTIISEMQAGKVTAHLTNDSVNGMAAFLSVSRFLSGLVQAVLYLLYIVYLSTVAALSGAVIAAIAGLAISKVLKATRAAGARTITEVHNISKISSTATRSAKEIIALNLTGYVLGKFDKNSKALMRANAINSRVGNSLKNIMDPLSLIAGLALTLFLIQFAKISSSEALILLMLVFRLLQSAKMTFADYQKFIGQEQGLRSIVLAIEGLEANRSVKLDNKRRNSQLDFTGSLRCEQLNVEYYGKPVLLDVNFQFKQGAISVISGASGTGKSTLISAILGLVSAKSGTIALGNVKLDENILTEWRDEFGYISQDPFLFEGTLIDNIVVGREVSNPFDLNTLLSAVGLSKFVEKRGGVNNFMLLEEGRNISGGQKQRIALARALYHQPKILLLDEPTSALDKDSELEFLKLLHQLKSKMIIICVTHSQALIQSADQHIDFNQIKAH